MPKKIRSSARGSIARPTPTFAAAQRSVVEFDPDYTNVKRDLKRIGILAGSFFAILIVLSFFLR
jgi:hypothetical protein